MCVCIYIFTYDKQDFKNDKNTCDTLEFNPCLKERCFR